MRLNLVKIREGKNEYICIFEGLINWWFVLVILKLSVYCKVN